MPSSALDNPYLFTGRRYDPETGWYYYRHRYLDPIAGRFVQRDPLGYKDGMNLYEYLRSNPINHRDPSGEFTLVEMLLVGVILAVVTYAFIMASRAFSNYANRMQNFFDAHNARIALASGVGIPEMVGSINIKLALYEGQDKQEIASILWRYSKIKSKRRMRN